jgi:hypothetical protein
MILKATRVILRAWQMADRDAFAELHSDPEVMRDLGGPLPERKAMRNSTATGPHLNKTDLPDGPWKIQC